MVNRSSSDKRFKLAVLLVALLVAAVVGSVLWAQHQNKPKTPQGVKLAPATEQEKKESEDNKDRIVAEQKKEQQAQAPTDSSSSSGKKQVNVVITAAAQDRVNAYVSGVFEDGGTCTATFTQNSTVLIRTSTGFENVSYTQCAPISPTLPNAGGWSVVVSYSSDSAQGKSSVQNF